MFLRAVLIPFAWTRLLLLGVAGFGAQMSTSWSYPFPEAARRGWAFLLLSVGALLAAVRGRFLLAGLLGLLLARR